MTDNPLNSRAILAAEIADSVRREVRAQQSAAQLSATIEKSLLEEARRAELKLAYLRGGAAAAFSIFVLGRLFLSRISSIPPPTTGSLGAALLWMTFAAAALAVLRRDWYKPWLRRGFPIADATLLVIGLGRLVRTPGGHWLAPVGPADRIDPCAAARRRGRCWYCTGRRYIGRHAGQSERGRKRE